MLLYRIKIQNGEDEYETYGYYSKYSKEDYDNNKLTDDIIISEFYDTDVSLNKFDDDTYWNGHKLVKVDGVWDISEEELATLHKFNIVYFMFNIGEDNA